MVASEHPPELIEPHTYLHRAFWDMAADFSAAGETRYQDFLTISLGQFGTYIAKLHKYAHGQDLVPGHVPQSTFWLAAEGEILLGTIRIRHWLNEQLTYEGGHIGYDIRPTYRGRGLGTLQLGLALLKAQALGLTRLLVTCDTDNIASACIIEKNGGELENQIISPSSGKLVSRYWITLSS
jgi:predicted acetyltransferase